MDIGSISRAVTSKEKLNLTTPASQLISLGFDKIKKGQTNTTANVPAGATTSIVFRFGIAGTTRTNGAVSDAFKGLQHKTLRISGANLNLKSSDISEVKLYIERVQPNGDISDSQTIDLFNYNKASDFQPTKITVDLNVILHPQDNLVISFKNDNAAVSYTISAQFTFEVLD